MIANPYFSIVIPAYNRAALLPETLDSLNKQSFVSWECIIVDDGSTDNTREVVSHLMAGDSRIRYVYQDNAERSAARNRGADLASGTYVLFLDSDDAYTNEHLQKLHEFIQKNEEPVALLITDNWEMHEPGNLVMPDLTHESAETIPYLWLVPVVPVRVCIHKTILATHKFDEQIVVVEDQVLWFHIASAFPVIRVPHRTAIYRIHPSNSVASANNPFKLRLNGLTRLFNATEYTTAKQLIPASIRGKMLAQCHFRIGEFSALQGYRTKALLSFIKCQFIAPGFRWKECLYTLLLRKSEKHTTGK